MKKPITVTVDRDVVEKIDQDRLTKDIGRSGVVRVALSEFYERRERLEKGENEKFTEE